MQWLDTYARSVCIGLDRLLSAIIFNEPDVTISSLCWVARTDRGKLADLRPWQIRALRGFGWILERAFPGHIALARHNDIEASSRARRILGAVHN